MDKKETVKDITKFILLTIAVSGVVVLAVTSPGLGYVLKEISKQKFKKYRNYKDYQIRSALKRLENRELITVKDSPNGETRIELLEKGHKRILNYKIEELKLMQKKWDGYWRVIVFDIPEKKRTARDFLRLKLKELGFYTLQKSVLITPWECRDIVDFVKHFYGVGDDVKILKVQCFDGEERVKNYFKI